METTLNYDWLQKKASWWIYTSLSHVIRRDWTSLGQLPLIHFNLPRISFYLPPSFLFSINILAHHSRRKSFTSISTILYTIGRTTRRLQSRTIKFHTPRGSDTRPIHPSLYSNVAFNPLTNLQPFFWLSSILIHFYDYLSSIAWINKFYLHDNAPGNSSKAPRYLEICLCLTHTNLSTPVVSHCPLAVFHHFGTFLVSLIPHLHHGRRPRLTTQQCHPRVRRRSFLFWQILFSRPNSVTREGNTEPRLQDSLKLPPKDARPQTEVRALSRFCPLVLCT